MSRTGIVPRAGSDPFYVRCVKCGEEFDSLIQADMHRDECGGRVFDVKRREEDDDEKPSWRYPTTL